MMAAWNKWSTEHHRSPLVGYNQQETCSWHLRMHWISHIPSGPGRLYKKWKGAVRDLFGRSAVYGDEGARAHHPPRIDAAADLAPRLLALAKLGLAKNGEHPWKPVSSSEEGQQTRPSSPGLDIQLTIKSSTQQNFHFLLMLTMFVLVEAISGTKKEKPHFTAHFL